MAGVKRILGDRGAGSSSARASPRSTIVGVVGGVLLWNDRDRLEVFARLDPAACLPAILSLSLRLLAGMLCMHLAITLGDALYQRFRWRKRQRMSKEEMKQEMKEIGRQPGGQGPHEADLRMARVKKRMMAAVPTATVVVTNPTHYAVALRYEAGMAAPICVAKGVDALALRIRAVAAEHGVAGDREPAARPGAPRHRGDRPRDPGRALPGGGRGDRLRHAPAPEGRVGPAAAEPDERPGKPRFVHLFSRGCAEARRDDSGAALPVP